MRAVEVLPTPLAPVNKKAWATRFCEMAFCKVLVICCCPTTSSKRCGLHFLANTKYDIALQLTPHPALTPEGRGKGRGENNLLIARLPCGTQRGLLPLLPSGPDGVCNLLLRRTRLSTRSYIPPPVHRPYMAEGFNEFLSPELRRIQGRHGPYVKNIFFSFRRPVVDL